MALMCSESLAKSSNSRGHNNGFGRGLEGVRKGVQREMFFMEVVAHNNKNSSGQEAGYSC